MYILKNAVTSIVRNKSRNILIGVIVLVISCAVAVTLAINNSSTSLIESYQSKYEVEATLGMNRENMMKDFDPKNRDDSKNDMAEKFNAASTITEEDIKNYADSEYVKSYSYTISAGVDSDDIEKASVSGGDRGFGGGMGPDGRGGEFLNESSSDFTVKGYSSFEAMTDFVEGNYKITDGEVSEDFDGNDCIINNELATVNDLAVGDTFKIIDPNTEKTYKLNITGIYEEVNSGEGGMNMFADSVNTIITNANFVAKMHEKDSELSINIMPTFVLTSKDVIEKFSEELTQKGLNENLTVETNLDKVENATSTISNVRSFAVTFLIVTLIIGTVVLLVINMINIRERRYEIGVLRTIGMKKSKVSLQFILELFMVSFVALILGAGLGAVVSVPVSNSLLQSEISSSQNAQQNIRDNFGKKDMGAIPGQPGEQPNDMPGKFSGVVEVAEFDSIDAVVDFGVLAELLGIGLIITLISSISAVASIQRFSPLTILKERS